MSGEYYRQCDTGCCRTSSAIKHQDFEKGYNESAKFKGKGLNEEPKRVGPKVPRKNSTQQKIQNIKEREKASDIRFGEGMDKAKVIKEHLYLHPDAPFTSSLLLTTYSSHDDANKPFSSGQWRIPDHIMTTPPENLILTDRPANEEKIPPNPSHFSVLPILRDFPTNSTFGEVSVGLGMEAYRCDKYYERCGLATAPGEMMQESDAYHPVGYSNLPAYYTPLDQHDNISEFCHLENHTNEWNEFSVNPRSAQIGQSASLIGEFPSCTSSLQSGATSGQASAIYNSGPSAFASMQCSEWFPLQMHDLPIPDLTAGVSSHDIVIPNDFAFTQEPSRFTFFPSPDVQHAQWF